MVTAVIYKSITGSCKKVAEMISAGIHVPAMPMGSKAPANGKVIYVGWTFAGSVAGLKDAMKKYDVAAVVQVGMAPSSEKTVAAVREKNEIASNVAVFSKQGGFNINKLPLPLKLIMKLKNKDIVKGLEKKKELNAQEKALYTMASTGVGEPADWDVSEIIKGCAAL